ncbi:hypothetical protein NDU88_004518 [Pleurodeles waltl]|uniref:Uncharacterized protein n=1 Tax=Pleurodeles waltl TaxID=8319 RepID=A0AAV7V391_PLEWA|nr:hypothetical protein NDU88_004518 [Pleurodeles waltl]
MGSAQGSEDSLPLIGSAPQRDITELYCEGPITLPCQGGLRLPWKALCKIYGHRKNSAPGATGEGRLWRAESAWSDRRETIVVRSTALDCQREKSSVGALRWNQRSYLVRVHRESSGVSALLRSSAGLNFRELGRRNLG